MAIIEDGANKNTASVDDNGRLLTNAIAIDDATRTSLENEDYFLVCNGGSGHPSAITDGYLLWLANNSFTQDCLIQSVSISTLSGGIWHIGIGGVISSADDTASVKNFNLRSSKIAPVTAYKAVSSAISFTANPSRLLGGHLLANTKWVESFNGSLILGNNNAIGVHWCGSGVVSVGIQFFMKDRV